MQLSYSSKVLVAGFHMVRKNTKSNQSDDLVFLWTKIN